MRRSIYLSDLTEAKLKTLGVGWSRAICLAVEEWDKLKLDKNAALQKSEKCEILKP
jgi:hypothetical protein